MVINLQRTQIYKNKVANAQEARMYKTNDISKTAGSLNLQDPNQKKLYELIRIEHLLLKWKMSYLKRLQ